MDTLPIKFEDICGKKLQDIKSESKYSIFEDCKNIIKTDKKHYETIKNNIVGKKCSEYIAKQLKEKKEVTRKDLLENCESFKKVEEKKKKGGRRGGGGKGGRPLPLPKPEEKKEKPDMFKNLIKELTTAMKSKDPVQAITQALTGYATKVCAGDTISLYEKGEFTKAYNEIYSTLFNKSNPESVVGWNEKKEWFLNSSIANVLGKAVKCIVALSGATLTGWGINQARLLLFGSTPTPTRTGLGPDNAPDLGGGRPDDDDSGGGGDDKDVKTTKSTTLQSTLDPQSTTTTTTAQTAPPTMGQIYTQMLQNQAKQQSKTASTGQFDTMAREMAEANIKEAVRKASEAKTQRRPTTAEATNPTAPKPEPAPKTPATEDTSLYSDIAKFVGAGTAFAGAIKGFEKMFGVGQMPNVVRTPQPQALPQGPPQATRQPGPTTGQQGLPKQQPRDSGVGKGAKQPYMPPTDFTPYIPPLALGIGALGAGDRGKTAGAGLALTALGFRPRDIPAEELDVAEAVERSMDPSVGKKREGVETSPGGTKRDSSEALRQLLKRQEELLQLEEERRQRMLDKLGPSVPLEGAMQDPRQPGLVEISNRDAPPVNIPVPTATPLDAQVGQSLQFETQRQQDEFARKGEGINIEDLEGMEGALGQAIDEVVEEEFGGEPDAQQQEQKDKQEKTLMEEAEEAGRQAEEETERAKQRDRVNYSEYVNPPKKKEGVRLEQSDDNEQLKEDIEIGAIGRTGDSYERLRDAVHRLVYYNYERGDDVWSALKRIRARISAMERADDSLADRDYKPPPKPDRKRPAE